MNIEKNMMPIDEWNKQFSCKHMQQPISFLTEENLNKLEQHCEKTIQYGNGRILEEHQVTLELIIRYRELLLEKDIWKNRYIEQVKYGNKITLDGEAVPHIIEIIKKDYISKDKLKKITYPTPENPIPIEVQQSEMYKKLVKEVEE